MKCYLLKREMGNLQEKLSYCNFENLDEDNVKKILDYCSDILIIGKAIIDNLPLEVKEEKALILKEKTKMYYDLKVELGL